MMTILKQIIIPILMIIPIFVMSISINRTIGAFTRWIIIVKIYAITLIGYYIRIVVS